MEAMEPMDMEASKDSVDTDISRDRLACLFESIKGWINGWMSH